MLFMKKQKIELINWSENFKQVLKYSLFLIFQIKSYIFKNIFKKMSTEVSNR